MRVNSVTIVPFESFVYYFELKHGVISYVVPYSLGQMQHQAYESLALHTDPAESLYADIEVGLFIVSAFQTEFVLLELKVGWVRVVGGSEQHARLVEVDLVGFKDGSTVHCDVRRHVEGEILVFSRQEIDARQCA